MQLEITLAQDVGKCHIEVMTSDMSIRARPSGGSFFPSSVSVVPTVPAITALPAAASAVTLAQRVAAVSGLTRAELRLAPAAAVSTTLLDLWAAMANRTAGELAAGEVHKDGTVRISSQVAVWLIGRVSEAYGRRKLVNLSRVKDVEKLRSLGGLTELLWKVINADTGGTLL